MSFSNLNLSPPLLKALQKSGYTEATPIQAQAIPRALAGKDLIATAQTGTGKTAAFVLPALENLLNSPKQTLPSILILAPVRELATQITEAIHKYSSQSRVKVASILGGMPYQAQMRQLSQPLDIIVATPGRLIDYLNRGNVNLSQIKMLVLDEADRMLDMGFIDDVKLISQHLPKKRQTLLFTATMDDRITKLAQTILHAPEHIAIKSGKSITLDKIKQSVYITDDILHKNQLLQHLLDSENIYKAIIFSATKSHADKLSRQLREQGHKVDALHGDIRQRKRNIILEQFRRGKTNLLVATDVAARGIDVSDISHVINFDIPRTAEDYVHRIGRTGRAGKDGRAISFIMNNETGQLRQIERYISGTISQEVIAGLEPKRVFKSSDKNNKNWRGRGGNKSRNHSKPQQHRHHDAADKSHSHSNKRSDRHFGKNSPKDFSERQPKSNYHGSRTKDDTRSNYADRKNPDQRPPKNMTGKPFHHRRAENKSNDSSQGNNERYIIRRRGKNTENPRNNSERRDFRSRDGDTTGRKNHSGNFSAQKKNNPRKRKFFGNAPKAE